MRGEIPQPKMGVTNEVSGLPPPCSSSSCSSSRSGRRKLPPLILNVSFLVLVGFYVSTANNYHIHPQSHNKSTFTAAATARPATNSSSPSSCLGDLHKLDGYEAKCAYITSSSHCRSQGYIDYLHLFYCVCGRLHPALGYTVLVSWLVVLFYLLGNTAATYFCSSLEGLSSVLKLAPSIAGVTLLSLGNGAPDVFSTLVSFKGSGSSDDVGFNSILGGAFFVSSVVTGVICLGIGPKSVAVNRGAFVRDVCFLLLALISLLLIVFVGEINIWGAIAFACIYLVYVLFAASASHFCREKDKLHLYLHLQQESDLGGPFLPVSSCSSSSSSNAAGFFPQERQEVEDLAVPLLGTSSRGDEFFDDEKKKSNNSCCWSRLTSLIWCCTRKVLFLLELPLYLPRRLTIPDASEERWSKPYAVISVTAAPVLLAALWEGEHASSRARPADQDDGPAFAASRVLSWWGGAAAAAGLVLGTITAVTTKKAHPPKTFLLPWLLGGFLMSVIWTYITADELVSLLVSLGDILGISASVLGLTVLAWGNSLGDLIANAAMAWRTGSGGPQMAISACYAGPTFNLLVGLGFSLVLASYATYPLPYVIPRDTSLYQTLGFLIGGLLWALAVLPARGMKLDKVLGIGLLAIYLCFMSVRLAQATGMISSAS